MINEVFAQTLGAYIDKRQATVAGWVALRPILYQFHFYFCPVICMRKLTCTPSSFRDIAARKSQVSAPKSNTACTTAR